MLDQTKQYWKNTLKSFEDSTENHTFDSSYLKNEVEYREDSINEDILHY